MAKSVEVWNTVWRDDSGQDLIEYALIACLIATAALTSIKGYANSVVSVWNYVGSSLKNTLG